MKKQSRFAAIILAVTALNFTADRAFSEEVYLIRGGFNVFSTGMDQMAQKLRFRGIKASSHGIMSWKGIANDIIKRSKAKKVSYPIIFLGHSLGADVAPEFASYLAENGVTVDLVIGFDATSNRTFNKGAKKVINYRTPMGGYYVKGQGFNGTITQVDVGEYGANHFTIEKVAGVQQLALGAVLSRLGRR